MRTGWKAVKKILKQLTLAVIGLLIVGTVAIYLNHQYQLREESGLFAGEGQRVRVNNHELNVYNEGSGEDTYVFMAGSGTASPMYELKGLYSKFSADHKIAVIERAGYGYSEIAGDDRDLDKILEESREALHRSGNKPPYILVSHSLSGLEAIYWAQKYPDEIKAIIGLDIGLPEEYVEYPLGRLDKLFMRGMNVMTRLGFQRLSPFMTYDPEIIRQTFLTEEEKRKFKAISYKHAFNEDMMRELLNAATNAGRSLKLPLPKGTPILFLSAYTEENQDSKYTRQKEEHYQVIAGQLDAAEVVRVKGKHSLYLYAPDEIFQLAEKFMDRL
ncbi:alpha/beta fold hydrolase [Paenibacillus sp. NPDC058177]|uniref:alpha/beta fold hydrolase n=1 Tax=Paenibacillus sp. NPDC058177 TaxID=3346369 RepID=UPI0036DC08F5